jgi:MoaA/NifB/PqqE/SkfB family radical SAM enzyme
MPQEGYPKIGSRLIRLLKRSADYRRGAVSYNSLGINVTAKCNSCCRFCEAHLLDSARDLSLERIKSLLREARDLGILKVSFSGGEPLMRKDIWSIIQQCCGLGLSYSILSNGLLVEGLGQEELAWLKKADSIDISLESHRAEVHNALRGAAGFFERTVRGIKVLRGHNIRVNTNTVICSLNLGDLAGMVRLGKELDVCYMAFQPLHRWSNYHAVPPIEKAHLSVGPRMISELEQSVADAVRVSGKIGQRTNLCMLQRWLVPFFRAQNSNDGRIWMKDVAPSFTCIGPFESALIDSDGSLCPCVMLPAYDDIKDKSLVEALRSLAPLKNALRQGRFHPDCYKCSCQMARNYSFTLVHHPVANFRNLCGAVWSLFSHHQN